MARVLGRRGGDIAVGWSLSRRGIAGVGCCVLAMLGVLSGNSVQAGAAEPAAVPARASKVVSTQAGKAQPKKGMARPARGRSLPLTKAAPPKSGDAQALVTSPNGDTLDVRYLNVSPGHATDQYGRASDCSGYVSPYDGLIGPCATIYAYDATYAGNGSIPAHDSSANNSQTVQVWDACGTQVMNDLTTGWHSNYLPDFPRLGTGGVGTSSGQPLSVTPSMCSGAWSVLWSFTQQFDDGQSLTATATATFTQNTDVPTAAQSREQGYGGSPIHASQGDPVDSLTGAFNYRPANAVDLGLASLGGPIGVARSYSSVSTYAGGFGPGWSDNLSEHLAVQPNGDVKYFAASGSVQLFTAAGPGVFTSPPGVLSKLSSAGSMFTLTSKALISETFDSTGHLKSISDRNGQGPLFQYTGSILTGVTGSGRSLTISHDPATGNISQVTGSDGRHVSYTYDASGRLATFVDATGATTSYGYDAGGRLNQVTDANGHYPVRLTYDPTTGRVSSQLDARGNQTTFGWSQTDPNNSGTGTATVTDPRGNTSTDKYVNGYVVHQIDPAGNDTHYSWTINGQVGQVVQPNGQYTYFAYDANGNLTSRSFPYGGPIENYQYNANNDLISTVDFNGTTATFGYSPAGNLLTITRPNVATGTGTVVAVTYTYNTNGTLHSSADASGNTTTYGYNAAGDLTSQTTPTGRITTFGRDGAGRETTLVDPRGNVTGANPTTYQTTFAYDNDDRTTTVTDPLSHSASTTYDPVGNPRIITDALGRSTTTTFDAEDRPTSIQGPDPGIAPATRTYDVDGNLDTATTPGGLTTTYTYDVTNHPATLTTPGGTWRYTYDSNGRMATHTAPSGHTTTYSRNPDGSVSMVIVSDGTTYYTNSYGYDRNGNRLSFAHGPDPTTYLTYNAVNQVTKATTGSGQSAQTTSYNYDNAGHLTGVTYPGAVAQTRTYDADGRLATVASGSTNLATYNYNTATGTVTLTQPGTVKTTTTFDNANRPAAVGTVQGTTVLAKSAYSLDASGNPTQILNADGTTNSYSYDTLNRLTKACYATNTCVGATSYTSWTYSPDGQRLTQQSPAGTTSYTYNAAERLTTRTGLDGSATYSYDSDGNLTSDGTNTYTWDLGGDLATTSTGGTTTSYTYDGLNHRNTITQGATTTTEITDPTTGQLVEEKSSNGGIVRQYTYGTAPLGFLASTGKPFNYVLDGTGAIRTTTDGSGNLQYGYTYDPYGKVTKTTTGRNPTTQPLTFQHNYNDGTSYRMGAREYRPDLGIFLSPDPAQAGGIGYGYANANPMSNVDPTGNDGENWMGMTHQEAAGVAVVSGVVSAVCTAVVVCAEIDVLTVPLALSAANVAWASDDSTISCFSHKGGCGATIVNGAMVAAGGAGGLAELGPAAEDASLAANAASKVGPTTAHGAERIAGAAATRGGVLAEEQILLVRGSGQLLTQADGASVRVLQNEAGRFDVVVDGSRGLITTFSNLSQKSLERLGTRYGWE